MVVASRAFRVGLPSLLGLVSALLAPLCASASLDPARIVSKVLSGPLEMVVALDDSSFVAGQRTCVLVCVTNRGETTIPFVPEPIYSDESRTSVNVWRIGTHGAWFLLRRTFTSCPFAIHPYAVPPISPLEPGGSVCYSSNLCTAYATNYPVVDRLRLKGGPTGAFLNSRFAMGRYALQVTYSLRGEQNGWREPLALESDTLFFEVTSPPASENDLLSRYAASIDSARGEPSPLRQELTARWLPRFLNSRFFETVFLQSGRFAQEIPRDRLFTWLDPYGTRPTSRALLLDLLFRISSSGARQDPAALSKFARGDLAKRVIEDWSSRPSRYHVRDSVYADRKKRLLREWPPYGTWIERDGYEEAAGK
jgi:hypothetical protein